MKSTTKNEDKKKKNSFRQYQFLVLNLLCGVNHNYKTKNAVAYDQISQSIVLAFIEFPVLNV